MHFRRVVGVFSASLQILARILKHAQVKERNRDDVFLRSKIHKATITETNFDYAGSITIHETLTRKVDLVEYDKVLVVDTRMKTELEPMSSKGSGIEA